jgi:elongation factor Ts
MITTEIVKQLREETGVSIMQCKKALEESGGDMEKARHALRKMSAASSEKKADRTLGAGVVRSYIHSNNKVGVLLEVNCETDFVAQNADFDQLATDVALHIAAMSPEFVTADMIPAEEQDRIKAYMAEEVANLDKPEEVKAKVLEGKLKDYFAEKTLLDQPFVKDPSITIKQLVDGVVQKTGERVEIRRFVRYEVV